MFANLIWTLYLFIAVYPAQSLGIQSFCIAKSVSVGETASISCHFTEDLSKPPGRDVNVYLYRDNDEGSELVLLYNWINGISRIERKLGYDLQGNLTDHMLVVIYNASKEHAGNYKCIAVGYPANLCTLHVKQEFEMSNITTPRRDTCCYTEPSSGSTSNGNNSKPDDINRTESGGSNDTVTIVCSSIAIILLISLSGIIFVAIQKRWICKPDGSSIINNNIKTNGQCAILIKQNGSSENPQLRPIEHGKGVTHHEISSLIPSETTQDHTKTSNDVLSCCHA